MEPSTQSHEAAPVDDRRHLADESDDCVQMSKESIELMIQPAPRSHTSAQIVATSANTNLADLKGIPEAIFPLPLELLSQIVRIHVLEHKGSIWVPMHVCRAFRSATLLNSKLWNSLSIPTESQSYHRVATTMTMCATEDQLACALSYSQSSTFDLEIHPSPALFTKLLPLFNANKPGAQIRSLYAHRLKQIPEDLYDQWDLSSLEILDTQDPVLVKRAWQDSKVIHTLRTDMSIFLQLEIMGSQSTICELGLDGDDSMPTFPPILDAFESLTTLRITCWYFIPPKIHLPRLRSLTLSGVAPFWPFECPILEYLSLSSPKPPDDNEIIHLPSVKEIHFIDIGWLLHFDLPAVEIVTLVEHNRTEAELVLDMIFPTSVNSQGLMPPLNPLVVDFRLLSIDMDPLILLLRRLNRCVKLVIGPNAIDHSFLDVLCPLWDEEAELEAAELRNNIPLPTLEHLCIDFWHIIDNLTWELADRESAEAELRATFTEACLDFLERRKKYGCPLKRLEITFSSNDLDDAWFTLV